MATSKGSGRIVSRIVVTYRLEDDPTERHLIIEHGKGAEVDALSWSPELMRKLAYLENGDCRAAPTEPDTGEWKISNGDSRSSGGSCVWLHTSSCTWKEVCADS